MIKLIIVLSLLVCPSMAFNLDRPFQVGDHVSIIQEKGTMEIFVYHGNITFINGDGIFSITGEEKKAHCLDFEPITNESIGRGLIMSMLQTPS